VKLEDHPTVRRLSEQVKGGENEQRAETMLNGTRFRRLALDCGADDAGLVEIAHRGLELQRDEILRNYPWTRSLLPTERALAPSTVTKKAGKSPRMIFEEVSMASETKPRAITVRGTARIPTAEGCSVL